MIIVSRHGSTFNYNTTISIIFTCFPANTLNMVALYIRDWDGRLKMIEMHVMKVDVELRILMPQAKPIY